VAVPPRSGVQVDSTAGRTRARSRVDATTKGRLLTQPAPPAMWLLARPLTGQAAVASQMCESSPRGSWTYVSVVVLSFAWPSHAWTRVGLIP